MLEHIVRHFVFESIDLQGCRYYMILILHNNLTVYTCTLGVGVVS